MSGEAVSAAAAARAVEIPTADGVILRGLLLGEGERWAVLVHDLGRDLDAWGDLPGWFAARGCAALAIDLRGHGASDGVSAAGALVSDVRAALAWSAARGARHVALLAEGRAAAAALVGAADPRAGAHVAALVLCSPRLDLPGQEQDAWREARAPKLILVGRHDRARRQAAHWLQRHAAGWAVAIFLPTVEQGADLTTGSLAATLREEIGLFLRDYGFGTPPP